MLASSPINSSPTLGPAGNLASTKYLAKQDREALLQYTKFFIRKAAQIIIQSRQEDKKPTKSHVVAYNTDWFNLSIKDLTLIIHMTKQTFGNVETIFTDNTPFCIEVSLRTPEGQTMILETWCILFNEQLADPTQKISYSVYKKMSLVLRSLLCITRTLPTYQLSRRQSHDTYVLMYRMYCAEPIVHHLGENYGTAKIGTVGTPIGSLIVNVAYRTRLTMTPQNSSHGPDYSGGIHIKDDHFSANSTPSTHSSQQHAAGAGAATPQRYQISGASPMVGTSKTQTSSGVPSSPDLIPPGYDDMIGNYSPPLVDLRSPRGAFVAGFGGSDRPPDQTLSSPLGPRRSTSNLITIDETSDTPTRATINRTTSKTQPIPMKSSQSQPSGISSGVATNTPRTNVGKNLQLQRYGSEAAGAVAVAHPEEITSSADEYSSSVGSTSDTIYYFKLKSAAFVPSSAVGSSSFSNNSNNLPPQYYSSSFGNLANDMNDLPPFIALLSNDFGNLSTTGGGNTGDSQLAIAQSPPAPNNFIEYPSRVNQQRLRNATMATQSVSSQDERIASPCSLPNFKMLDHLHHHQQQHNFLNSPTSNAHNQIEPDDFVFIESKKIAFGLSNAADDLRNFFRACENAPMLDSFHNEPLFNDVLKELDQQLLSYESKVAEFDDLVKSLDNN